jgi:hypothetical protein
MPTVRVKLKATGQTGTVDQAEAQASPDKFQLLDQPQSQDQAPQQQPQNQGLISKALNFLLPATTKSLGDLGQGKLSGGDVLKTGLELGSFFVPFGKGASLLSKFLLPGAAVGGLQALSKEKPTPESVVGGTLTGGASAGVLGKILPGLGKLPGAANDAAARTYSQAFDIAPKAATTLKPLNTIKEVLNHGANFSGSLDKLATNSQAAVSAVDKLNRAALAGVKNVPMPELTPAIEGAFQHSPLISATEKKAIRQSILSTVNPTAARLDATNALDALDATRQLESIGYQYLHGSTPMTPNLKYEQIGKTYLDAASAIKDTLEKALSKTGSLESVKTPEALAQLSQISPRLAEQYSKATNLGQARSTIAPFVRLNQMVDLTNNATQAVGGKGANIGLESMGLGGAAGFGVGGPLGGVIGAGVGAAARPLVQAGVNLARAPLATGAGRGLNTLSNITGDIGSPLLKQILLQGAARTPSLIGGSDNPNNNQNQEPNQQNAQSTQTLPQSVNNVNSNIPTKDQFQQAVMADMQQNGGKNFARYKQLYDFLYPAKSGTTASDQRAQSGLAIANNINSIPTDIRGATGSPEAFGVIGKMNIPVVGKALIGGKREVALADLESKYFTLVQTALTAIQGSRPSDYDVRSYQKALGPSISNSPEVNATRIKTITELLSGGGSQ